MATRQLLTMDAVINCVVSDDEDYDDPDEPVMAGSDDFSDLKPVTITQFTAPVGPAVNIPKSPLEVFELFFT